MTNDAGPEGTPTAQPTKAAREVAENFDIGTERYTVNEFGQRVGWPMEGWSGAAAPKGVRLAGDFVALEPFQPHHATGLADAMVAAPPQAYTYMTFGPFETTEQWIAYARSASEDPDSVMYAVVIRGKPVGIASYLRINPSAGSIEIGSIFFTPELSRTTAATEALYLLLRHAFMGCAYRRVEWKCDALNEPSRRAALRLGMQFEGLWRKATHYKGRSRNTAWYAMTDDDFTAVEPVFEAWLKKVSTPGAEAPRLSQAISAALS